MTKEEFAQKMLDIISGEIKEKNMWECSKEAFLKLPDPNTFEWAEIHMPVIKNPGDQDGPFVVIEVHFRRQWTGGEYVWVQYGIGDEAF